MRRRLYASSIAILLCSLCFAQQTITALPAISDTIQTGYVVVTSISGGGPGLSVTETFGEFVGGSLFQSSVLSSPLVTLTSVIVNTNSNVGIDTGVAILNPNDIAATLTLSLRDSQGVTVGTRIIGIEARQQVSRFVSELFAGDPGLATTNPGLLFINASVPVSVLGLSFTGPSFTSLPVATQLSDNNVVTAVSTTPTVATFTGAFSTLPVVQPIIPAISSFGTISNIGTISTFGTISTAVGTNVVTVPNTPIISNAPVVSNTPVISVVPVTTTTQAIFNNTPVTQAVAFFPQTTSFGVATATGVFFLPQIATGGGWVSEVTIANTSAVAQTVRVDFFNSVGGPLLLPIGSTLTNVVIVPGGVVTFSTAR